MLRAVHVIVRGQVQGVGFRAFTLREAARLGISGWVQNRGDGTVEVVLQGPDAVVERLLVALRVGPPLAKVAGLTITPHAGEVEAGFRSRPSD